MYFPTLIYFSSCKQTKNCFYFFVCFFIKFMEQEFKNFRDSLESKNSLEILTNYTNLLKKVVENVSNENVESLDIKYLLEAINKIKKIYENSQKVFDEVSNEKIDEVEVGNKLNNMEISYNLLFEYLRKNSSGTK